MTQENGRKAWAWLAAVAGLLVLGSAGAWADPVASNNSGTFTVRITPNVDLGVTVDTTGAAWAGSTNLDVTMDLATDKVLGTGVKLTIAGNFQNQELQLSGANAATWTLDTDEVDGQDQMRLYGLIGNDQTVAPAVGTFAGAQNLITTVASNAGQSPANEGSASPGTGHVYEFLDTAAPQYAQIDNMAVGQIRRLWLRASTPSTTTTDVQQNFVVTVTAINGSTN